MATASRTSRENVIGAHIAEARTRAIFAGYGINGVTAPLLDLVKGDKFDFNALDSDQTAALQQFVANYAATVQADHDRMAKNGGFTKERINPLDTWGGLDETTQFIKALNFGAYRISRPVTVLLTAVLDDLLKSLGAHGIEQMHQLAPKAVHINMKFALTDIENTPLFALIFNSVVLANARASIDAPATEEDDADDTDDTPTASGPNFLHYIGVLVHSTNSSDRRIGLRSDFKQFLNDIAYEFLTMRLTNILRELMVLTSGRIVKDVHVYSALRIMLLEGGVNPNDYLETLSQRMETYAEFAALDTAEAKQQFVQSRGTAAPQVVKPARSPRTKAAPAPVEPEPVPEPEPVKPAKKSRGRRATAAPTEEPATEPKKVRKSRKATSSGDKPRRRKTVVKE